MSICHNRHVFFVFVYFFSVLHSNEYGIVEVDGGRILAYTSLAFMYLDLMQRFYGQIHRRYEKKKMIDFRTVYIFELDLIWIQKK